jgi:cytochrome b561
MFLPVKGKVPRMTQPGRYTRLAMLFHWLIAALITANVLMIWVVDYLPDHFERPIIDTHKSIGITVLGLAIMRLLWRLTHPAPALPASYKKWERVAAHSAHIALYLLIFCLPLSGWIHDSAWKGAPTHPLNLFGFIPWFRIGPIVHQDPQTKEYIHSLFSQIHTSLAYVLYAMFAVHVAGALKHQFLDKQPELQRMLPGGPLA